MDDVRDATDRWFIRRGFPHAIEHYSATEDVFTRAFPFLLFVLFVELFVTFGDRFAGWAQAGVFIAGFGVLFAAFVIVNLVRRRSPMRLPDDIGVWELSVFVIGPAVLPLWFTDRGWTGAVTIVVVNLVLLGVAFVVTSYGLVPAVRVGLVQAFRQVRTVTQLVARGLPLLLLITAFIFLNAEMWQVANDFTWAFFAVCVALIVALALAFLVLRVPREVDQLAQFDTWGDVEDLVQQTDAPVADDMPVLRGIPPAPDLTRVEVVNIGILLTISQVVQTLLLGVAAGAFYVLFGMFAVREATILQWTTQDRLDPIVQFDVFSGHVVLTWEHLAVAGFVAAFSVLQFAVTSVTDSTYRDEFYADVAGDVRASLAVRAVVRELPSDDRRSPTGAGP